MEATTTKSIDKDQDAVWVVNTAAFRWAHGIREGVYFDPNVPTRVKMDDWIKGQAPILQVVDDPHGELPESPVKNDTPLRKEPDSPKGKGK